MTGVEELRLNDDLEELVLLGDMSDNCQILVKDNGASLRLQLDRSLPKVLGLKDLGAIHCSNILEIDFAQILNNYPRLRELRLWGKPGHILNFHKLSELKRVSHIFHCGFVWLYCRRYSQTRRFTSIKHVLDE